MKLSRCPAVHIAFAAVVWAGTGALGSDLVIYDDQASTQLSQLERVSEVPEAAFAGEAGLRVEPTYWHTPIIRIASGRTDFRPFSRLKFVIRSTAGSIDPSILAWDYARGAQLRIAEYTQGGVVDEQWRAVSIPVPELASEDFALESVYLIGFGPMKDPVAFFVDDIVLEDAARPTASAWHCRSSRVLTVTFDAFDHAAIADPRQFSIHSDSDTQYLTPQSPLGVGSDRIARSVSQSGQNLIADAHLHLLLPFPLKSGHTYRVDLSGVRSGAGLPPADPFLTVTYDPAAVSSSIQVNQVGYLPRATKIAFVGNWMGDLGPMPVDALAFDVVGADQGDPAWSGELRLRIADDARSGADLYEAEFSGLTRPGSYQLSVPGIGRSYPFDIAEDLYDDVYRTTARVFYHKRNGTLAAPFADPGFERAGIDPLLNGVFHPVLADYPLSRGEQGFTFMPVVKGWYDAGDYGQYVHNAAGVWPTIGLAFDLAPAGRFADGELGIPESGNGIPDLLDELGWGMEWALSMQDDDGGVYWRIASGHWDESLPADITEPRFIYEKTTRATAQLAAMGAIYARLILPYDPVRADAALAAAQRAWAYLEGQPIWPPEGTAYTNPEQYPGGGTYAVTSSKPDMLWAAAELYRTTADARFQDQYRALQSQVDVDVSAAPMSTWAYWAMAQADYPSRDAILAEEARRGLLIAADTKLRWAGEDPYRAPKHPHIPFTGWYNFSVSPIAALPLLQAYRLTGARPYADVALQSLDIILGANPLSRSWLTGIGDDPVRDPLDKLSLYGAHPEPLRGLTVSGVTWHLPADNALYAGVNAAYYPPEAPLSDGDYASAYPVLRRWIDDHMLVPMNESTVREWACVAVAFGLLRDGTDALPIAPVRYEWVPGQSKSGRVYRLSDIPLAEVARLTPAQIAAFGSEAVNAPPEWIEALSAEQVAAIDAPGTAYWVAKLNAAQQSALTATQIAAFEHWSLFTALPAEKVALVPPASMPGLGVEVRNTTDAWKAALTQAQWAAMTEEQIAILHAAGY